MLRWVTMCPAMKGRTMTELAVSFPCKDLNPAHPGLPTSIILIYYYSFAGIYETILNSKWQESEDNSNKKP